MSSTANLNEPSSEAHLHAVLPEQLCTNTLQTKEAQQIRFRNLLRSEGAAKASNAFFFQLSAHSQSIVAALTFRRSRQVSAINPFLLESLTYPLSRYLR
ncbi:hypothetical protein SynA15127_02199 [Synechococcus sp. A15-127]|nr:hypothetical protein SynA15127_02199 [Synechococcus sp. A15-127]